MKIQLNTAIVAACLLFAMVAQADATTFTFTPEGFPNTLTGDWGYQYNWDPPGVPQANDTAIVADIDYGGDTYKVQCYASGDEDVGTLTVQSASGGT